MRLTSKYKFEIIKDEKSKGYFFSPANGLGIMDLHAQTDNIVVRLPKELRTGIDAIDQQHQQLMDRVHQLNDILKIHYPTKDLQQKAVEDHVAEMIDNFTSHFSFEESLMASAQYQFFNAHKQVHKTLILRAWEYLERLASGEDIAGELHSVLKTWLLNHIRDEDGSYAPIVKKRMKKAGKSNSGWLHGLTKRFSSKK